MSTSEQDAIPEHVHTFTTDGRVAPASLAPITKRAREAYDARYTENPDNYWASLEMITPLHEGRPFVYAKEPGDSNKEVVALSAERMDPLRADFLRFVLRYAGVVDRDDKPLSVVEYAHDFTAPRGTNIFGQAAANIEDVLDMRGFQRLHLVGIRTGSVAMSHLVQSSIIDRFQIASSLHVDDPSHSSRGALDLRRRLRSDRREATRSPRLWAADGPAPYSDAAAGARWGSWLFANRSDLAGINKASHAALRRDNFSGVLLAAMRKHTLEQQFGLTVAFGNGALADGMPEVLAQDESQRLGDLGILRSIRAKGFAPSSYVYNLVSLADMCLRSVTFGQEVSRQNRHP